MKRYRVVGLHYKDHEPNGRPFSVYVVVTDSTPWKGDAARFVEIDIDEAIGAFQQGWLSSEVKYRQSTLGRCKAAPHSAKPH